MERITRIDKLKIGVGYVIIDWMPSAALGVGNGEWVKLAATIKIANDLSPLREQEALIHEIIHVIMERIEDEEEVAMTGENVVQHIAFYIQSIIHDNPGLDIFKKLSIDEDLEWKRKNLRGEK